MGVGLWTFLTFWCWQVPLDQIETMHGMKDGWIWIAMGLLSSQIFSNLSACLGKKYHAHFCRSVTAPRKCATQLWRQYL